MEAQDDLATQMTLEQGKTPAESKAEIFYAASFVKWFAEEGKRVYGETILSPVQDRRVLVMKQPVGVCAIITPWNFPAAMITCNIAPALAADCTVAANDTPFGLAAYFYTNDLTRGFRASEELEVGMIGLNVGGFATQVAPFSGVKESGLGREGAQHGIDEYLEVRTLHISSIA